MASCGGYNFLHIELIPTPIPTSPSSSIAKVYFGIEMLHTTPNEMLLLWIKLYVREQKCQRQHDCLILVSLQLCWSVPSVLVCALRQANTGHSHDNGINTVFRAGTLRRMETSYSFLCFSFPDRDSLINIISLDALLNSERRKPTAKESGTYGLLRILHIPTYTIYVGLNPLNWIKK